MSDVLVWHVTSEAHSPYQIQQSLNGPTPSDTTECLQVRSLSHVTSHTSPGILFSFGGQALPQHRNDAARLRSEGHATSPKKNTRQIPTTHYLPEKWAKLLQLGLSFPRPSAERKHVSGKRDHESKTRLRMKFMLKG